MYDYDIAISFANEQRKFAEKLALLFHKTYKLKVFYDDYEQAKLIGTNLYKYLSDIYTNKARYCAILVSKSYKINRWTRVEWDAAQVRAFKEPDVTYIIPIGIDDTVLPELEATGYLPLKRLTISKIANIIFSMIESEVEKLKIVRIAQEHYTNNKFQRAIDLVKDKIFDDNIEALRIRGDAYGKLHQYKEGIKALEKISEFLPDDFLAHFLLGIFYYRIENFDKSVREYEAAEKIYPDHPTIKSDLPSARRKRRIQKIKSMFFLK